MNYTNEYSSRKNYMAKMDKERKDIQFPCYLERLFQIAKLHKNFDEVCSLLEKHYKKIADCDLFRSWYHKDKNTIEKIFSAEAKGLFNSDSMFIESALDIYGPKKLIQGLKEKAGIV